VNQTDTPSPAPERRMLWWSILWKYSIFEAGDSAWSLIIVSTYFGAFLQVVLMEPAANLGWAVTAGALIIALISPILGAAADNSGRRQPYLRFFVFGVVLSTAGLAWATTVPLAMLLFILAYICVNGAFTFFSAMTPAVSDERNVAGVISMTVGVGYAGGLVCLLTLSRLVSADELAGRVFLPMSLIYLVFAFPAMYLAPDVPPRGHRRSMCKRPTSDSGRLSGRRSGTRTCSASWLEISFTKTPLPPSSP
jgi:UMF1 family MFS transporter